MGLSALLRPRVAFASPEAQVVFTSLTARECAGPLSASALGEIRGVVWHRSAQESHVVGNQEHSPTDVGEISRGWFQVVPVSVSTLESDIGLRWIQRFQRPR